MSFLLPDIDNELQKFEKKTVKTIKNHQNDIYKKCVLVLPLTCKMVQTICY